jgi:regulatory protein YycI of two-component signal transduction system YycFG
MKPEWQMPRTCQPITQHAQMDNNMVKGIYMFGVIILHISRPSFFLNLKALISLYTLKKNKMRGDHFTWYEGLEKKKKKGLKISN